MLRLKHINCWFILLLLLGLSACSDSNSDDEDLGPNLSVTPLSLRFKESKTDTVLINYDGKWEASLSDTTWCRLDKSSGKGKGEIVVALKSRNSVDLKATKLIVRATDKPSVLQVVNLLLDGIEFYADPIAVEFGYGDNAIYAVNVVCEGGWTATLDDDSWCGLDKTSGDGDGKIQISSHFDLANFGGKNAVLTISSTKNPEMKTTVEIKQVREFTHGSCITLHKATKGKGIDFVIQGDGFTKESMGVNGYWHRHMQLSMEGIFKYEPLASYKEYFNVYAVTAVSASNIIKGGETSNTFFGAHFDKEGGAYLSLRSNAEASDFAYTHSPVAKEKETAENMFILMLVNTTKYGGIASMNYGDPNRYSGMGITTLFDGSGNGGPSREDYYHPLLVHEFIGHAFGRLVDEYEQELNGTKQTIPNREKENSIQVKKAYGVGQNIEYTSDPSQFDNKAWQKLLEMRYPGVGVIEGGAHYSYGCWRSLESDMMRGYYETPFFSPVNREILLRQIYKLAGKESEYNLNVFLEYDKKNLQK